MKPGEWVDTILDSTGEFMRLETSDGVRREGKISGFTYRTFKLNGQEVKWPTEIEVNGDPNDRIPLDRVAHMTIG